MPFSSPAALYFCGGAEFAGAADAGGGLVAAGPGVGVSELGLLSFWLLELELRELGRLEFGLLLLFGTGLAWVGEVGSVGLPADGVGVVGVMGVSPAFGRTGEFGVSTGGAVDGCVDAPGVELGYVDGDGVLGWSGTVDGVAVPGTDGVDWDGVPDGAGAEDGAL